MNGEMKYVITKHDKTCTTNDYIAAAAVASAWGAGATVRIKVKNRTSTALWVEGHEGFNAVDSHVKFAACVSERMRAWINSTL